LAQALPIATSFPVCPLFPVAAIAASYLHTVFNCWRHMDKLSNCVEGIVDASKFQSAQESLISTEAEAELYEAETSSNSSKDGDDFSSDLTGGLPSEGSALHAAGLCRPCAFVNSKAGCRNDMNCAFCHAPHQTESKRRPCKAKRDRVRRFIERMENMIEENPTSFNEDDPKLLPSIEHSAVLREKVMTRLRNHSEKVQTTMRGWEAQPHECGLDVWDNTPCDAMNQFSPSTSRASGGRGIMPVASAPLFMECGYEPPLPMGVDLNDITSDILLAQGMNRSFFVQRVRL